ncbi:hypothetical protein D3C71_1764500 [compost metagenome]
MPPAGLKPTFALDSRMARNMMSAASSVALTETLPVEVLMKSAPAAIASSDERLTSAMSRISPVSRMTLSVDCGQAARTASTIVVTAVSSPAMKAL